MFNKIVVKSIFVLVIIALISGLMLSISNDLLAVSESEIVAFRLKKVYSQASIESEEEIDEGFEYASGEVKGVYLMTDGAVIVAAKGFNGYKNGWIICYIAFSADGVLKNIVIDSNNYQSLVSSISKAWIKDNFCDKDVKNINAFVTSGSGDGVYTVVSGATMSSNAVANSVNTAVGYLRHIKFLPTI